MSQPRVAGGRRNARGVGDMLRTIAVFGVVVAAVYFIVPHSAKGGLAPVAYRAPIQAFAGRAGYPVLGPTSLPAGWRANHVLVHVSAGQPRSLDAGFYDAPDNAYAALEESNAPVRVFLRAQQVTGPAGGTVRAGGRTYRVWRASAGPGRAALVAPLGHGGTVVLDGGAPLPVLLELAARLAPVR